MRQSRREHVRGLAAVVLGVCLATAGLVAQTPALEPDGAAPEAEAWNLHGQTTAIGSWKPAFPAIYTNLGGSPNSLRPEAERGFTVSATVTLGVRAWKGGALFVSPELISEKPFSDLKGLAGAIQDVDLQKGGAAAPHLYRARAYLQQTVSLGGAPVAHVSAPLQLGGPARARELTVRAGNFSVLDFMGGNPAGLDPRQGFLSLAFLTYPAWDFGSDARGYAWGALADLAWDQWSLRLARLTPPRLPNQLPVDFRLWRVHGDQVEMERRLSLRGQAGSVRALVFRNRERIGRFKDAVQAWLADPLKNATTCAGFSYDSPNAQAPDLCWARKPNVKLGAGVSVDQGMVGGLDLFARAMVADGQSEVDAYTPTDRSLSAGLLTSGGRWHRARDLVGIGFSEGWISAAHADYLRRGGIDGFIGDGTITPGGERLVEVFYRVPLTTGLWASADVQHISHPAFNRDRGPVRVFGLRLHSEF